MELLLGHYFYVKYENDLEKLFKTLHESEEYTELLCSSKRVITASFQAALEAKNSGLIDNRPTKKYLELLNDIDQKLDNRSRYLNDLMMEIKSKFTKRSKNIVQKNHNYLIEMKTGETPAEELLLEIITLGKDVQKVINEEIPAYKKELEAYMKKTENMICADAYRYYNKIMKLDSGTLPSLKVREWTHLQYELFRTSGAFVHQSYEA